MERARSQRPTVPSAELELLDAAAALAERRAELVTVLEEDVHPRSSGSRPRSARHVAQRATSRRGEGWPSMRAEPACSRGRSRARAGGDSARLPSEPVVRRRVDRNRACPESDRERVRVAIAGRLDAHQRRQEPGRALEQVLAARAPGAARLGAGGWDARRRSVGRRRPHRTPSGAHVRLMTTLGSSATGPRQRGRGLRPRGPRRVTEATESTT